MPRSDPEADRHLSGASELHVLQRVRRWDRLRARVLDVGAAVRGRRHAVEARLHGLVLAAVGHCRDGVLQHHAVRPFPSGAHRRDQGGVPGDGAYALRLSEPRAQDAHGEEAAVMYSAIGHFVFGTSFIVEPKLKNVGQTRNAKDLSGVQSPAPKREFHAATVGRSPSILPAWRLQASQ